MCWLVEIKQTNLLNSITANRVVSGSLMNKRLWDGIRQGRGGLGFELGKMVDLDEVKRN